jgi:hypothetical protein
MELLTALLTGFFFWLLVFHWYRRTSARRREEAGKLLFRATTAIPAWRRHRWALVLCVCMLLMLLIDIGNIMQHAAEDPGEQLLPLMSFIDVVVRFWAVLLFAVPLGRTDIALEVREEGVLHSMTGKNRWLGRMKFTTWCQIEECKWAATLTALAARPVLGILRIAEDVIGPQGMGAVTAALGQFVPVYDCDGTLLVKPESPSVAKIRLPSDRRFARLPFQFDLQSLLILTVAVACAAGRYAIHYQHLTPAREALATLDTFKPSVDYFGYGISHLDFWDCTVKPTDDDLAILEPFVELRMLHLSGPAITDAGLKHLKGLKKLRWVFLKDTRVTPEGIADLKRSLPRAEICSADAVPRPGAGGGTVTAPPGAKAGDKEK